MALEKPERFIITCYGHNTASELTRGKYYWSNKLFTDERFPLEKHASYKRVIEPVEFDHHCSTEDVVNEWRRRELLRPTYEDALYFGVQQHEAYARRPWIFLHHPVDAPGSGCTGSFPRYIVLYSFNGMRVIDLYVDDGWIKFCLFAGIRVEN
ncbi:hypothetical protein A2833_02220 [Candidatus Azambacteria bacterium RIFCSPHIGHO2_01_FULL_44_55]|uniref:Uncharacterized protein n=1 Tax=Candidatus Azambacteria bacterium RIFCSPLOWO2_02_FULL_44_14 TaxID=1797306 RepID=A0A1F5CCR1_9BACT|nr:MAG: hypothetical protein A3A18_01590 [Candidatus Azambacteria bacterium RIFCSPLOWO2_01_FULL_44_84]OGD32971.1 MAG: hypothetical protein A3C78_00375 [Candidatus Azambacteria bacterium RIFCSPHIGHO2_02_FULL_45_18]OGD40415.1 MAG: hypothetical protein A2833_02220 [Candidatus Azambacteria bacterium RIFCSPHIGHO2_01_FULL_44_55]OGD40627.1 MAG: hypothetical protein A3I30_01240 [Candidatus Azambacteria bacterium RIFCSPLOWO2_02_FULL_44_14]OGD52316.1 MAG: hypothetical protein A2608_00190 [Candidatus Azam